LDDISARRSRSRKRDLRQHQHYHAQWGTILCGANANGSSYISVREAHHWRRCGHAESCAAAAVNIRQRHGGGSNGTATLIIAASSGSTLGPYDNLHGAGFTQVSGVIAATSADCHQLDGQGGSWAAPIFIPATQTLIPVPDLAMLRSRCDDDTLSGCHLRFRHAGVFH